MAYNSHDEGRVCDGGAAGCLHCGRVLCRALPVAGEVRLELIAAIADLLAMMLLATVVFAIAVLPE
jgi:hypothetical protein